MSITGMSEPRVEPFALKSETTVYSCSRTNYPFCSAPVMKRQAIFTASSFVVHR